MYAMSFQIDGDDDLVDPSSNAEPMEGTDGSEGRSRQASTAPGEGAANGNGAGKSNKDKSHDAIMFVEWPGAPVRDVVTTMWANDEDG